MTNIQKYYLVHIGSIQSILSSSVLFGPIQSILSSYYSSIQSNLVNFGPFSPHLPYSIHIGHILSTLFLWSILSTLVLFGPIRSILSALVLFGPIRSILFTLVLFGPFYPLRSYSIHNATIWSDLVPFSPIQSHSVHSIYSDHIQSIHSYFVHLVMFCPFGPIWSIQITSVCFGPLRSIFVHLHNEKIHV